jgi:hypothetical protein
MMEVMAERERSGTFLPTIGYMHPYYKVNYM